MKSYMGPKKASGPNYSNRNIPDSIKKKAEKLK
jgi:hypothetical protein